MWWREVFFHLISSSLLSPRTPAHVSILISCWCQLWGLAERLNSVYTAADQCSRCTITQAQVGHLLYPSLFLSVSARRRCTAGGWCEISSAHREREQAIALSPICASLSVGLGVPVGDVGRDVLFCQDGFLLWLNAIRIHPFFRIQA